jgi:uncharacterized protein
MQYPKLSGQLAAKRVVLKRADIPLTNVEKFAGSGARKIRGLASSVRPDRVGDVVEPAGGTWNLPLPLLLQHSHSDPIGWVRSIEVRNNGLWIEAEFAEGFAKADESWRMVEAGLMDSLSIGFRSIKSSPLPSGGLRFEKWELLEISVVTVPANADAKIRRERQPAQLAIGAGKGSVKLATNTPAGGVPLIQNKKGIKLVRADGAIPLLTNKKPGEK